MPSPGTPLGRTKGFVLFVPPAIDDAGLTHLEFRVLFHLLRRGGRDSDAYPSIGSMAKVCCVCPDSIKTALRALTQKNILVTVPRAVQGSRNIRFQALLTVGSFTLAALALWGDKLKNWLFAPRLRFSVDLSPPYCQKFPAGIWFRIRVTNEASTEATNVSIWIQEIYRGSEAYPIRVDVTPIPLVWTHEAGATIPVLNPHFSRYVDVGTLVPEGNQSRFILCTVPEPAGGATHLAPGSYWIHLTITASNARPHSAWFAFDVPPFNPPTQEVGLTEVRLRPSAFSRPIA